jgi:DNA-nicking Smr family endonuclease
MAPSDRRRRTLSQDERELWTTVTRSIAPLRETPETVPEEAAAASPPPPPAPRPRRAAAPSAKPAPAPAPKPAAPPPVEPLGRRMRSRVARGAEAIDGRLDLHGLTQSEAHAALLRFLRTAQAREARLVLVITGKGSRNLRGDGSERGVLRRQVPQWLQLPEFRVFVIGMEDAHAAHGGEGALYIRVRRKRS